MSNTVELDQVSKTFPGGIVAVDNLSLAVREGEFVTLLGPSGCGKTTTLRMIAGFEAPDSGRVFLSGEDVTDLPPYKRRVNTVFQDYALFPHMSVTQNIGYGLRVAGVPREEIQRRVEESLRMVDLLDKRDVRPAALSGGQKQRVGLARALIRNPKVLLLDEPLSALDVKLRDAMQIELKHLHQKLGITFILVTHDQKEALVLSDRVVVMDSGRVVQAGTPAELYDRPATPYVANFIGVSNFVHARIADVSNGMIVAEAGGLSLRVRAEGSRAERGNNVLLAVRPEKAQLLINGAAAPEGSNRIEGRIVDHLFQGNLVRLGIDIGQKHPFMLDIQLNLGLGDSSLPNPGSAVAFAVHPSAISLFVDKGQN
ncbi:MAG: ABC transporter ATP-binding protein [Dongiaceae bacterium]